jgi:hypothetical protein
MKINGIDLSVKQTEETLKKLGSEIVESGEVTECLLYIIDNSNELDYNILNTNFNILCKHNIQIDKTYNNIDNMSDDELSVLDNFEFKTLKVEVE